MDKQRRERDDQVTKIMGEYLLKGYTMLDEYCDICQIPLMRSRDKVLICVSCLQDDTKPIANNINQNQNGNSSLISKNDIDLAQSIDLTQSKVNENENESELTETAILKSDNQTNNGTMNSDFNLNLNIQNDIQNTKNIVHKKMCWASNKLETCTSIKTCKKLCCLIKECANTLKALDNLDNIVTST